MPITGEAAGFQHGTSSSSGTNLEKCANCEEPYSEAAVFCGQCGMYLCTSCDVDIHKNKAFRQHKRINIVERRKELEALEMHNRMCSNSPMVRGQVEDDAKNKFCYFCPNERCIIFLPRLAELVKDPKARPSMVSLIGPTGVGKSFLLKYLLLMEGVKGDKDMPVIGAAADPQSTSADIHIYAGRQDSADPLLYLDSEGRGGSKKPHGVSHLLNAIWRGPRSSEDEKSYAESRYKHVQMSYPRMLYIFSDVLCFVFSGNWREKSNILEPLLEWGNTASFGADNQHKPQLIIIFNKTGKETYDDSYDDFKMTFQKWIKEDEKKGKELLSYYWQPLVVCVPHMDMAGADKKVPSRVAKLRDAIMESTQRIRAKRREGKLLFTRSQLELYMRKVAGQFSKDSTATFDIYKAMVADSAIIGVEGYIVKFRLELEKAIPEDSSSQKFMTSLMVLNSSVKQSMLLWISRNLDLTSFPSPKLPGDLRKALEDAKNIIDGEMPCCAKGFNCGTLKKNHKDEHSGAPDSVDQHFGPWNKLANLSISGSMILQFMTLHSIRFGGGFYADPKVENAMTTYGNLVNLAENVFMSVSGRDVRYIRELVLRHRQSARDKYWWLKSFFSYQVCVICLLNLPTEMLSCGHIICDMCAKEEAEASSHAETRLAMPINLSCPVCQSDAKWYPTNLSPLAGCRILSLDGGGVRGIVELLSLKEIMDYFPGMHVEDLFDIVIGTSTGGIIALALTVRKPEEKPMRLPRVIDLFKHLAGEVFSQKQLNFGASNRLFSMICQYFKIHDSKYKNDALLRLLKEHLGKKSLLQSCVGGPRVIITACNYDREAAAAWFTSYNCPSNDNDGTQRVSGGCLLNAMDVAAATSAAPTYLPHVSIGDYRWVDGGLRYNGPPQIAIDEAKELWPERQVSALISLGCGKSDQGSVETKNLGVLQLFELVVNIALDAEDQCNTAIRHLNTRNPVLYESKSGPGLRLNPIIDLMGKTCDLDDVNKMVLLIEQTEKYLNSPDGKAVVGRAANLLFAALFHLHIGADENLHAQSLTHLRIRSCSALPLHLKDALLKNSSDHFSVTVNTDGATTSKFDWMRCTWDQDCMDLPFSLDGLPTTRPLSMVVNLNMCLPGTKKPAKPLPISGMPYILKVD